MDDRSIINLLWQRNDSALNALAIKFGRGLLAMARNILQDLRDAEEAVSDTYLALWNAIPPANPDPLTPYVFRVGRNTALNRRRNITSQKRSGYELSLDELAETLAGPGLEERVTARALGQTIDRFLAEQSQSTRIIFLRRYWYNASVAEIASQLAISETAVKSTLHRLRIRLKQTLEKEGIL